jgi:hypothetical protein
MSNMNKIPFPSWMIGLLSTSIIALLAVGVLAWQWIAWERMIAETENQIRSASDALFQTPAGPLGEKTANPQATDTALKSQWRDILSQVQHPYFKNQIDLFFEEPDFSPDPQVGSPQDKPRVVWLMLPESLGKFVLANRTFLDSIHDTIAKSAELAPFYTNDFRSFQALCDLIFLDAASCLDSHEQARFDRALESVYQIQIINKQFSRLDTVNSAIVCLLHRGLDENLISPTQASRWLERIYQDTKPDLGGAMVAPDKVSLFRSYDERWGHWQSLPSLRMAMFDRYFQETAAQYLTLPTVLDRIKFQDSLRYYTLAVRVAMQNAVAQNPGLSRLPDGFDERLQIPSDFRQAMADSKLDDRSGYSIDRTTYELKSATEGQLSFVLPGELTSGRHPIGSRYPMAIKAP